MISRFIRISCSRLSPAIVLLAFAPFLADAQNQEALSQFFEGKNVTVKMDMPGSQKGVDIYPDRNPTLDTKSYSSRLRQYGTSLRSGDSVVISKVKVKSDVIEFQLGGGGYGVAADNTDAGVHFQPADKSSHEKELEDQLSKETDPDRRRSLSAELDDLRRDRERQDRRNQSRAQEDADRRKDDINAGRAQGGSRFNLKIKRSGAEAFTPQFVMAALSQYVYFPPDGFGKEGSHLGPVINSGPPAPPAPQQPAPDANPPELRKGLTRAQVEQLFGPPLDSHDEADGSMTKTTATYQNAKETVKAEFVNGVLVQYSTSSR